MKKILSIVLALLLICSVAVACVACTDTNDGEKIYDKVTKTMKLNKSYEGKSFLTDGIGLATVNRYTDGDTTSFRLVEEGTVIAIRYYEIDTPESTGGVEKWGKAASNFTKHILESATEIVLESSTGGAAEKDAYGTRYLGYVWYRTSLGGSFKCLNLQIVENGYSRNTGMNTGVYPYYSYFQKAEEAAERNALHIFSNKDDPLFNDKPIDTTIKEIWQKLTPSDNPAYEDNKGYDPEFYNADADSGAKVRFMAYMESVTVSSSDTFTFRAVYYNSETGERDEIDIYCMYSNNPQSRLHLGGLYQVTGSIQSHGGGFQISGITYNTILLNTKDNTLEKQTDYYLTFDNSVAYRHPQYENTLYTNVTVKEVKGVENGVLTFTGTASHRTNNGNQDPIEFTFTVKVGATDNYSKIVAGASLAIRGYQLVTGSHSITIASLSAIQ